VTPPTAKEIARARAVLEREERWQATKAAAKEEMAKRSGSLVFLTPGQEPVVVLPEGGDPDAPPQQVIFYAPARPSRPSQRSALTTAEHPARSPSQRQPF
jgi:hypothetical protein